MLSGFDKHYDFQLPGGCSAFCCYRREHEALRLYAASLPTELSDEKMQLLLARVSPWRREQALRFVQRADSWRSLIGELLWLQAAKDHGIEEEHPQVAWQTHGKPYLARHSDFHFNVAHSGSWVACAAHDRPVGVDVERICTPVALSVAEQFMSTDELRIFQAHTDSARVDFFYRLWTLKESFLKATGSGLTLPPNSFEALKPSPATSHWRFLSGALDHEHLLAICLCTTCYIAEHHS